MKLLGLHVVDGGVEASLIRFEGNEVIGEGIEVSALVVELVEDDNKGGGETCPPLILLGQQAVVGYCSCTTVPHVPSTAGTVAP
jgi:hypothetical protein